MKNIETLFEYKHNDMGNLYNIFRINHEDKVTVVINQVEEEPYSVLATIEYDDVGFEYKSPYLSWKNVILCSNAYCISPYYEYMNNSVQSKKKVAGTIYPREYDENIKIIESIPDYCNYYEYKKEDELYPAVIYICFKGTLEEYFDLNTIKDIYKRHNCFDIIDWSIIQEYFTKELITLGNSNEKLHSVPGLSYYDSLVILGLLYGYPIESTISLFEGKTKRVGVERHMAKDMMKSSGTNECVLRGEKYFMYGGKVKMEWQELNRYIKA